MKSAAKLALVGLLFLAPPARSQSPPIVAPLPPAQVKADFLKLLDRPMVPLEVHVGGPSPSIPGLNCERVDFATEKHPDGTLERVPALVVRPEGLNAGERRPAVIVLHGTGGTKEGLRPWLERLAHRGFVAVAIDGRYHGERAHGEKGTWMYNEAIVRAWRSKSGEPQAHPFYFDTCWDVWRTVDYLQTRPDVDPGRIGLVGISKGGIEAWLAGAVDERIKVTVPAISVQSFRWSLEHERWQARANTIKEAHQAAARDLGEEAVNARVCRELWSKIIPGILDEFDGPSMLRLFAGRSLLILNGQRDPNCPLEGAEIAFKAAGTAFHEAGADDHFRVMVAKDIGHATTKDQEAVAVDWFARWLDLASHHSTP